MLWKLPNNSLLKYSTKMMNEIWEDLVVVEEVVVAVVEDEVVLEFHVAEVCTIYLLESIHYNLVQNLNDQTGLYV